MKAYIQKEDVPTIDLAAAHYGLKDAGYDIVFFNKDDIERIPKHAGIIVGYIDEIQRWFELNGIGKQIAINIPDDLNKPKYLKRNISIMSMDEFRQNIKPPIFIKPARFPKEFQAGVIKLESSKEFLKDVS